MGPESVVSALIRELERTPPEVQQSALAQVAIRLAANLDEEAAPHMMAAVARELRATLEVLLRFSSGEVSAVDDLAKRRVARRSEVSKRSAGADVSGPGGG